MSPDRPIRTALSDRPEPIRRVGTTLILGSGRHVRVLTLPRVCGQRLLAHLWDDCFGADGSADDLVVWWPPDRPDPSRN